MRRFQIDFAVRELDVPEEQARGVRFSEAVPAGKIFDYLTRVRDAVVTLVGGDRGNSSQPPPAAPPPARGLPRRAAPEAERPWTRPMEPWVHRPGPCDPRERWDEGIGERIRRSWGLLKMSLH